MTAPPPAFSRSRERAGALPVSTRIYQGIGALPDTYKTFAFNTFLLIFYNQVLGLPAYLASIAIMLALAVDAITDPLVGSFSDGLRHRLGRRHPLMYASVAPIGVSLYLVFSPPEGMTQTGLFLWLLATVVSTRIAMTFFVVPWSALFPELSDDYAERSSVITYRFLLGAAGAIVFTWCTWTFLFPSSPDGAPGHLTPDGYPRFAVVLALAVAGSALLTTALTQREIPYLRQPDRVSRFAPRRAVSDVVAALKNGDFLVLFVGLLIASAITGTVQALEIYINTYFWGFGPEQLRWFAIAVIGLVAAFVSLPVLQQRFDKKHLLVGSMIFSLVNGIGFISLRFLDVLPANGEPLLLQILVANEVVRVWAGAITVIMFISMVADTLDAQELHTGQRQEGVFSAAISFSAKATSGIGIFAAGLLLDYAIGFPMGTRPSALGNDLVVRLGLVAGISVPLLYLVPFWIATRYRISRARHGEITRQLAARRTAARGPNEGGRT